MGSLFTLRAPVKRPIVGTSVGDIVRVSRSSPVMDIRPKGSISLLGGKDKIRGRSSIQVSGPIRTGAGSDVITGQKNLEVLGFDRQKGKISMGRGRDVIRFKNGTVSLIEGSVVTGSGNDLITGTGAFWSDSGVSMGKGNDRIDIRGDMSVNSYGGIGMGAGDDYLRVQGVLKLDASIIRMGSGNDTMNLLAGGLDTSSVDEFPTIDLGKGDDRFIGFASSFPDPDPFVRGAQDPILIGNKGIDTIVLPTGVYTVTPTQISTRLASLRLGGFEVLEGINGGSFSYASGVLTVDNNGIASFTAALG